MKKQKKKTKKGKKNQNKQKKEKEKNKLIWKNEKKNLETGSLKKNLNKKIIN